MKTNDRFLISKKPIYLDYNATTPHDPEVIAAMRPFLEQHFGNPSNSYSYGTLTRTAVQTAREQVAATLNCHTDEIFFTSCATESNNWALKGVAFACRNRGNHIITSQVEHPAVIEVCRFLEQNGFLVTYLPVDIHGLVAVKDIERTITSKTILISIMHANNEVGTIQPVAEIARIAKRQGIIFHSDGAQAVGKIPSDLPELGVDLYTIAGHKLYAPKGIGALYIRKGTSIDRFLHGAGQEMGMRAGTENVLHIVGLGKACEIAARDLHQNSAHMKEMRDALFSGLQERLKGVHLNGHPEKSLPNTLSLCFEGIEATRLLAEVGDNVAASAGAACHSGAHMISSVLKAMQVPENLAIGTIRFSTGRFTTIEDIQQSVSLISAAVAIIRTAAHTKRN